MGISVRSELKMSDLVGRTVTKALINPSKDYVFLETDKGPLHLTWVGDCCAHCFLANITGSDALVGAQILAVENSEWKDLEKSEEYGDTVESMGTKIRTLKGYVDFESRVSHNGYYGGWIQISDLSPLDQYSNTVDDDDIGEMQPLKDF